MQRSDARIRLCSVIYSFNKPLRAEMILKYPVHSCPVRRVEFHVPLIAVPFRRSIPPLSSETPGPGYARHSSPRPLKMDHGRRLVHNFHRSGYRWTKPTQPAGLLEIISTPRVCIQILQKRQHLATVRPVRVAEECTTYTFATLPVFLIHHCAKPGHRQIYLRGITTMAPKQISMFNPHLRRKCFDRYLCNRSCGRVCR